MELLDQQQELMLKGRFEEGIKLSNKLMTELDSLSEEDRLRAIFNRGWIELHAGRYTDGMQCLDAGRLFKCFGNPPRTGKPIIKPDQDISGKTVALILEGGIGDHIITVRFAKAIRDKGANCLVVSCFQHLLPVFSRVEGVDNVAYVDEIPSLDFDYWVPGFSAGWVLGYDWDTLWNGPYISSLESSKPMWKNFFDSLQPDDNKIPKIGIKWGGNPQFEHQQFRTFPSEKILELFDTDAGMFFSLQKEDHDLDLPQNVVDMKFFMETWEDTLSIIEQLDIVITSCTSIAHAASAMGKPTWVIIPILPYFVWAYGDSHSTPYYSSNTSLFRQTDHENWDEPFEELKQCLLYLKQQRETSTSELT